MFIELISVELWVVTNFTFDFFEPVLLTMKIGPTGISLLFMENNNSCKCFKCCHSLLLLVINR